MNTMSAINTKAAFKIEKIAGCALILLIALLACNAAAIKMLEAPYETLSMGAATPTDISVSQSDQPMDSDASGTGDAGSTSAPAAVLTSSATETTEADHPYKDNDSPYRIVVYLKSQSVIVYKTAADGGLGKIAKQFTCSSGISYSPTPPGEYLSGEKYRWRKLQGDVYGQFCTRIGGNYLFHSTPFLQQDPCTLKNDEYDKLGRAASMGCIRMCVRDCKWVYDNIPKKTPVSIVDEKGPYGFKPPKRKSDPVYNGWDPTDKWAGGNPYFDSNAAQQIRDSLTSAATTTTTAAPATSTAPEATATSQSAAVEGQENQS